MAMFIVRDPACVFIHIPKTGGASIRKAFFKGNHGEPHFYELPPEAEDFFRFAFVRNPFDRLVSAFHMFTSGLENAASRLYDRGNQDSPYRRAMSFADFVSIVLDESVRFDEQRASLEERIRHHTIPQRHRLHGLQHAQFVGRYEHFDQDFRQVARRLGCQQHPLPRLNRSVNRRSYREYFNAEVRRQVEMYYEEDLMSLGYAF